MGGDLTPDQEAALRTLAPVLGDDFYLRGGVAVTLRLHHGTSHDLDLFASDVDPVSLEERLAQLTGVGVSSRAPGTLHLEPSASFVIATALRAQVAWTDRGHAVRALVYFADADHEPMPVELTGETWGEIKRDLQAWVLALPPE